MRNGAPPLRVGVVHDLSEPSPWVNSLCHLLKQLPNVDVQLLRTRDHNPHESKRPPWLVDRIYAMSRSRFDPFGPLTIPASASLASELVDAIRAADRDLIIWLAPFPGPHLEAQGLAKHGFLTVRFGDQNLGVPFWDEVANGIPTSAVSMFWHDRSFMQGYLVRQAETPIQSGIYMTANAEQPLVAAIRMLADLCLEIQDQGAVFSERVRRLVPQLLDHNKQPNYPSNLDAARFIVKKLSRSARLRWTTRGKTAMWFVALRPNRGDSIVDPARLNLAGFREVPFPRGVEAMADPFLVEMSGRHYLLFEEQSSGKSRGRLGCAEVRPDGSYSDMTIVLERPYHLSYPCIVPSKGDPAARNL